MSKKEPWPWGKCECGRFPLLCESCAAGWGDADARKRLAIGLFQENEALRAQLAEVRADRGDAGLRHAARAGQLADLRTLVVEICEELEDMAYALSRDRGDQVSERTQLMLERARKAVGGKQP